MRVTILGSGTGWFRKDRWAPGYLVEEGDFCLLLDCGPGVFRRIIELGKALEDISAIFVSHYHPDHVSDIIPFFFAIKYEMGYKKAIPVCVYTSELFLEFFENLKKAFNEWVVPPEDKVKFHFLPIKKKYEFKLGVFEAMITPVKHNPESLAIRLEKDGKFLVYSGDTGYCEELINLAKGADVAIFECSNSLDYKVEHHLGPEEVADIAERAKVKKLVVSHLYPHSEWEGLKNYIEKYFSGEVIIAEDFMNLEV